MRDYLILTVWARMKKADYIKGWRWGGVPGIRLYFCWQWENTTTVLENNGRFAYTVAIHFWKLLKRKCQLGASPAARIWSGGGGGAQRELPKGRASWDIGCPEVGERRDARKPPTPRPRSRAPPRHPVLVPHQALHSTVPHK